MGNVCSAKQADYTISVYTGDKRNAGTDSNFTIILHDEYGNASPEYELDNRFQNDFERGGMNRSKVNLPQSVRSQFGKIVKIEFWRDDFGIASDWYLDRIDVLDFRTNENFIFPVLRWVKAKRHYKINHLDTALPQEDENKKQRQKELQEKRTVYTLAQKVPNGPAQVNIMPDDERFSWDSKFKMAKLGLELNAEVAIEKIKTGKWDSLKSIEDIYDGRLLTMPAAAGTWQSDLYFGWQRIAGCSYDLIKLCKGIPDNFGATDEMLEPLLEGKSLQEALDKNALYIVDLAIMVGLSTNENQVVCSPLALFYQNNKDQLLPIAIQLFQEKAPDNPVFLPTDPPYTWLMAKMWYNMADASFHQSITHLGCTHLLMEGICVSAHRNLSLSHPIFKLLAPHFLYLIAINSRGLQVLIAPGGWVDKALAVGIEGMFELIEKGLDTWRVNVDGQLPERLKERGVLALDTLKCYPFRDDALLLFDVIKRYVTKYINHYYDTPEKIVGDWELQGWGSELTRSRPNDGVGLQGVAGNGNFSTVDGVIELLTAIIYTCSVAHAAANFPQYDQYAFSPNYPGILQGKPPTDKSPLTEEDILKTIPDVGQTLDMASITKSLSQRDTMCLGNFEVNYIFDPPAKKFVDEFRTDLQEIGKRIRERNKKCDLPYPYLDPQFIPNAISI